MQLPSSHVFGFMANSMNDALHMRQTGRKRLALSSGFLRCSWVEKGMSIKLFKTQGKVCALKWYYNPSLCN